MKSFPSQKDKDIRFLLNMVAKMDAIIDVCVIEKAEDKFYND